MKNTIKSKNTQDKYDDMMQSMMNMREIIWDISTVYLQEFSRHFPLCRKLGMRRDISLP
jgi:hypothetical protein